MIDDSLTDQLVDVSSMVSMISHIVTDMCKKMDAQKVLLISDKGNLVIVDSMNSPIPEEIKSKRFMKTNTRSATKDIMKVLLILLGVTVVGTQCTIRQYGIIYRFIMWFLFENEEWVSIGAVHDFCLFIKKQFIQGPSFVDQDKWKQMKEQRMNQFYASLDPVQSTNDHVSTSPIPIPDLEKIKIDVQTAQDSIVSVHQTVQVYMKDMTETIQLLSKQIEDQKDLYSSLQSQLQDNKYMCDTVQEYMTIHVRQLHEEISESVSHVKGELVGQLTQIKHDMSSQLTQVQHDMSDRVDKVQDDMSDRVDKVQDDMSDRINKIQDDMFNKVNQVQDDMSSRLNQVHSDMSDKVNQVQNDMFDKVNQVQHDMTSQVTHVQYEMSDKVNQVQDDMSSKVSEFQKDVSSQLFLLRESIVWTSTELKEQITVIYEKNKVEVMRLAEQLRIACEPVDSDSSTSTSVQTDPIPCVPSEPIPSIPSESIPSVPSESTTDSINSTTTTELIADSTTTTELIADSKLIEASESTTDESEVSTSPSTSVESDSSSCIEDTSVESIVPTVVEPIVPIVVESIVPIVVESIMPIVVDSDHNIEMIHEAPLLSVESTVLEPIVETITAMTIEVHTPNSDCISIHEAEIDSMDDETNATEDSDPVPLLSKKISLDLVPEPPMIIDPDTVSSSSEDHDVDGDIQIVKQGNYYMIRGTRVVINSTTCHAIGYLDELSVFHCECNDYVKQVCAEYDIEFQ